MRKTMLILLFGGALGLAAATPSTANAFWMRGRFGMMNPMMNCWWWNQNMFHPRPMSPFIVTGPRTITPFNFQGFNGFAYHFPTNFRQMNSNNSMTSLLMTGGFRALAFNPNTGSFMARIMTPNIKGFVISPFVGMQTINVPSSTFSIPLGNNIPSFYLNYLEANFFRP
jgi:hypothetical protein